jgi:hypothetical protein
MMVSVVLKKGNFVPVHAVKAYIERRDITLLILNLIIDGGGYK